MLCLFSPVLWGCALLKIDFSHDIAHTYFMKRVICLLLILSLLFGCRSFVHETEWNFLVYMAADNNLERFAIKDINEMELVGSSSSVNIFVLIDRIPGYDSSNGDWTSTRLYKITRDPIGSQEIVSTLIRDYGELDMADPKTLADFVDYCNTNYPARKTALTLWDHGTGVYPRNISPETRGIGQDYTTGLSFWDMLLTDEIAAALAPITKEKKIDLINMDACLMQMVEVGWEFSDVAHFMTGSQALTPGEGNDYTSLLGYLQQNPQSTAENFARFVVNSFYSTYYQEWPLPTNYGVLSLDLLQKEVIPSFTQVVKKLLSLSDEELLIIQSIRDSNVSEADEDMSEYVDMVDFFQELKASNIPHVQEFVSDIDQLLHALDQSILYHKEIGFGESGSFYQNIPLNGLSINMPYTPESFGYYSSDQGYGLLRIAKESDWYDFLKRLSALNYLENLSPL